MELNKSINTKERSKIILLCLGLNNKKKKINDLQIKDIFKIFKIFGKILKIIIFSKKKILKAFLEFENNEITEKVKIFLHEHFIDDLGKARIYFSDRQKLDFSNKFLEYKDYTLKENLENCSTELNSSISSKKEEEEKKKQKNQNENSNIFLNNNILDNFLSKISLSSEKKKKINDLKKNSDFIPSRVILISELSILFTKGIQIFNLFKNFGEIKTIIFMGNLHKVLIEFTEFEFSTFCVNQMNNLIIFGCPLKIQYSKYQEIDLKKSKSTNAMSYNEILHFKINDCEKENYDLNNFEKNSCGNFNYKQNSNKINNNEKIYQNYNEINNEKIYQNYNEKNNEKIYQNYNENNNNQKNYQNSNKINNNEKIYQNYNEINNNEKIYQNYNEKNNYQNYNENNNNKNNLTSTLPSKILIAKIVHMNNFNSNTLYSTILNFEGLSKIEIISKNKKSSCFKFTFNNLDCALKFIIDSNNEFRNAYKIDLSFDK